MAQLTWRNVDAPNFSGAAAGFRAFSDLIGNAGNTASAAIGAYDDTTRMDAANPGIQAYFQAAAQGNPNAAKEALAQHSAAFGGLRADQLSKVLTDGGRMASTSLGNLNDQFKYATGLRNDNDQLAATAVLNQVGSRIGSNADVYGVLSKNAAYGSMTPTQQQMVQRGLQGQGWQFQGPSGMGAGAPGTGSAPSFGSSNPTTAAIGGAVGTGTSRADRNANPGNLKAPEGTWVRSAPGFLGVDSGGFAKFDSPANGLAAMATQLNRYREGTQATGGKPVKTVEGIVGTWSPTSDPLNAPGSTNNYTKYVAGKLGLNPGDEVPADKMSAMAQAMYEFESGNRSGATNRIDARANSGKDGVGAQVDLAMANALHNTGPLNKLFKAAEDTETSTADLAKRLADKTGAPVQEFNSKITEIVNEHKVPASVAAAILENGGMTKYTGDGFLWNKGIRGWMKDENRWGDGWRPDDVAIKEQADAFLTNKTQINAVTNKGNAKLGAQLKSATDSRDAAVAEFMRIMAASKSNPDLLSDALPNAEDRMTSASAYLDKLTAQQNSSPQAKQTPTENDANMPKPAAKTVAAEPVDARAELAAAYQARLKKADLPKSNLLGYLLGQ